MGISFSGLGSGLPIQDWITALTDIKKQPISTLESKKKTLEYKQSDLNVLKLGYTSLSDAAKKLSTALSGTSSDVFATNKISISDTKSLSATVSSSTPRQSLSVEVLRLATNTVAKSSNENTPKIDGDSVFSSLANGSAKEGTFSIFVDNKRFEIDIESTDSLDTIAGKINALDAGISASVTDGKFSITTTTATSLKLGTASDGSNFAAVLALSQGPDGNFSSSRDIFTVKGSSNLKDLFGADILGDFVIGGETLNIDANTTLDSLLTKINSSEKAKVNASFDFVSGQMVLTSKSEGEFNINIEAGSSKFTKILGLTDENGKLQSDTQKLGKNALLKIDDNLITSFSNTVTSETTGINGLTLNLLNTTEENKPITIKIEQDTDAITKSIKSFIDAYNSVVSQTKTATSSTGQLKNETELNSLSYQLTQAMTNPFDDNVLKILSAIGISTGAGGASYSKEYSKIQLDETKFLNALKQDPESVKRLVEDAAKKVENIASQALKSETGYFATKAESITKQIDSVSKDITRKTDALAVYTAQITKQYNAMDQLIGKMQNQYNSFTSLIGSSS